MSNWVIVPKDEDLQHGKYLKKVLPKKKKLNTGVGNSGSPYRNEWALYDISDMKNAAFGTSGGINARNSAIEKRRKDTGKPAPSPTKPTNKAQAVLDKAKTQSLINKKKKESAGKAKKKNPNARTR